MRPQKERLAAFARDVLREMDKRHRFDEDFTAEVYDLARQHNLLKSVPGAPTETIMRGLP